jgi:hypothetical protein
LSNPSKTRFLGLALATSSSLCFDFKKNNFIQFENN